jgi:hypothetical protein
MENIRSINRQNKFGVHKYSADEFGLSREQIYKAYEQYLAAFGNDFIGEN